MVGEGRVVCDLVPCVPDRPGPKLGGDGFISRPRRAGVLTEALDLVELARVRIAGYRSLRLRAKLVGGVKDKGCDLGPTREDWRGKAWRNWAEITRVVAGNEGRRGSCGSVVRASGQKPRGDVASDLDPVLLAGAIRNGRQLTRKQLVQAGLQFGVEVRVERCQRVVERDMEGRLW